MADGDRGHVADEHRRALVVDDQGMADFVRGMNQADAAHHRRLSAEIDGLAADIDVGVAERREHLRHRQSVAHQLVLIDRDVVSLGLAAPTGHIDDSRHRLEAPLEHPVLERLEIGHRIVGRTDHPIAEDLADGTGGGDLRLGSVRQGSEFGQPVDHPLLGLVVGEVIRKLHLHIGETEQRYGADRLHVGYAGHLNFERNRDVAFDFLGGLAGALGDDVDQRRHRVGIGFDVERKKAGDAGAEHHHQQHDDQDALP